MQSGLDVRDASVNALLQDVAALLQLLRRQGGNSLLDHLQKQVLPALDLSFASQVISAGFLRFKNSIVAS